MKKILILLVVAAFLVSCNLPIIGGTATPAPTQPPVSTQPISPTQPPVTEVPVLPSATPIQGTEVNLGGVYMIIPPCLPVTASGVIVPFQQEEGPGSIWPQHRQISYSGYPLSGKFWEPTMRVFPVAEYEAMASFVIDQVSAMQNLITTRADVGANSVPFLPNLGAAQVFHADAHYIDFQNGSGVGFLTEYAQYYAPVNNHDLFYTFQGLTSDGKYWISAVFPVNLPFLQETWDSVSVPPDGIPAPSMSSPTYSEDMDAYYTTMLNRLNTTPPDSFTPSLACLDQYISSLNIGD